MSVMRISSEKLRGKNWVEKLDFQKLLASNLGMQFLGLSLASKTYLSVWSLLGLVLITVVSLLAVLSKDLTSEVWLKRPRLKRGLYSVIGLLLSCVFLLDTFVPSVLAQSTGTGGIFGQMKTRVSNLFNAVGNDNLQNFIGLTFGVMEALFWIYVIWSIVRVVQAFRENEDWQNAAKTPLLVVVMVAAINVIMGMV